MDWVNDNDGKRSIDFVERKLLDKNYNTVLDWSSFDASAFEQVANKDQPGGYVGLNDDSEAIGVWIMRTGAKAEIDEIVLSEGEGAWCTDSEELRVGDGSTSGGVNPSERTYLQTRAAGTAYTLTNTSAAVTFGTLSPTVTLNKAGNWRVRFTAVVKYVGATFAASQAVTIKLRRTNNTAADLVGGSTVAHTDIVTTKTYTLAVVQCEADLYQTSNVDDIVTIFADVAATPSAGSLQIVEAFISAEHMAF